MDGQKCISFFHSTRSTTFHRKKFTECGRSFSGLGWLRLGLAGRSVGRVDCQSVVSVGRLVGCCCLFVVGVWLLLVVVAWLLLVVVVGWLLVVGCVCCV